MTCLFLSSCSVQDVHFYRYVNESCVTDGDTMLNLETGVVSKDINNRYVQPLYFFATDTTYTLSPGDMNNYSGTLDDLSSYELKLKENGYVTESMVFNNQYIDTVLVGPSGDKVRLLYVSTGIIKIWAMSSEENITIPPYIA